MNVLHALALSVASLALLYHGPLAHANGCSKNREADAISNKIVGIALNEHAVFNGHRIDAGGRLWKFGSTETENEPLVDPVTGKPGAPGSTVPAWRRVWEYWLVLDQHVAGIALSRKVTAFPGVLNREAAPAEASEKTLHELFSLIGREPSDGAQDLRQAVVRSALSDSPWSAAFISYVMHHAGLDEGQFRYAAAHWQYVKQAFTADPHRAYRACDPRRTRPREGDLLCYSRGDQGPKDFENWRSAINLPGFSAASHCEIVIRVDRAANKMETVGGNVLQSVAMRRLKLNANGVLSSGHYVRGSEKPLLPGCAGDRSCRPTDLNTQRWSVLLQLR